MATATRHEAPVTRAGARAMTTPTLDLLLGGGLSIAITLALLAVRPGFAHDDLNRRLIFWSALINWPHFMASLGLLYGSRERVREHTFTAIVFPLSLIALSVALAGATVRSEIPLLLATLATSAYLAWHYTGQAFGMIVAFGHVEGLPLLPRERAPIRIALRLLLALHVAWIHHLLPEGAFPEAFVAPVVALYDLLLLALPLAFALGLLGLGRYARRIGRVPPARVCAPLVAVHLWYVLLAVEPGALVVVQLYHAMQYLVFPIRTEVNGYVEAMRGARGEAPTGAAQVRYAAVYYVGLVAAGVVVLYLLPMVLQNGVERFLGLAAPAAAAGVCVQMIVNVHHYLTDAVIWKQRDPRVRQALFGHLG